MSYVLSCPSTSPGRPGVRCIASRRGTRSSRCSSPRHSWREAEARLVKDPLIPRRSPTRCASASPHSPPGARTALLPDRRPRKPTLRYCGKAAIERDVVQEAVRAGVLHVDGDRVRFTLAPSDRWCTGMPRYRETRRPQAPWPPLSPTRRSMRCISPAGRWIGRGRRLHPRGDRRPGGEAGGHPEIAAELAEHAARLTAAERGTPRAARTGDGAVPHRGR